MKRWWMKEIKCKEIFKLCKEIILIQSVQFLAVLAPKGRFAAVSTKIPSMIPTKGRIKAHIKIKDSINFKILWLFKVYWKRAHVKYKSMSWEEIQNISLIVGLRHAWIMNS